MLGDGWITNNDVFFANGIYSKQNEYYAKILEKYSSSSSKNIKNK
jgi:hypothetical protein